MAFPITISDVGLPVVISTNGYGLPVVILNGGVIPPTDEVTTFTPTASGYTGENYDHFLETPPVPTSTGYALETA